MIFNLKRSTRYIFLLFSETRSGNPDLIMKQTMSWFSSLLNSSSSLCGTSKPPYFPLNCTGPSFVSIKLSESMSRTFSKSWMEEHRTTRITSFCTALSNNCWASSWAIGIDVRSKVWFHDTKCCRKDLSLHKPTSGQVLTIQVSALLWAFFTRYSQKLSAFS